MAQYYTFFRLGQAGYRAVPQACRDVATYLSRRIGEWGPFRLLSAQPGPQHPAGGASVFHH